MERIYVSLFILLVSATTAHAQDAENTDSTSVELREILVTSKRSATKLVGNTLVSTIAGTNLQNIGTCLDVLAQLPLLTVSDGAVSVIGKGTPEIYINGSPLRDGEELVQMQSSDIKKVELLMAPGSMYASNTNAVLKITTKKKFFNGLSLIDRSEIAMRHKISANDFLDLNYHTNKLDLFASGTLAHNNSLIKGTTINTLLFNGTPTVVGSSQNKTFPSNNFPIKIGFNYSSDYQSFGAYYRFNSEHGEINNHGSEWLDNEPHINRTIDNTTRSKSHLVSTYYDKTFNGKYTLHFDGNFRSSISNSNTLTSYPGSEPFVVASGERRTSNLWAGKLYLGIPLWDGNFTFGTQDSYTKTTLDYNMLSDKISEYIPSSLTNAKQTTAAAFARWERAFGKMSLSAGLRYEFNDYVFFVNGKKDNELSRTDNLLTPDISLSYMFNDKAQASLSYRMATLRPPYSQLTSGLSYVGRHEMEGGNPALRDERRHNIQLFGMWNNFILQADFSRSVDTYAYVKKLYPANDLQLIMQPINIDVSFMDIYLVWSKLIRSWSPNVTVGMHRQWLDIEGIHYYRPIFSYYLDNTISLPKGFLVTLNAYGQTSGDIHTNRFGKSWFVLDASVSKSFFNKALQVNLSATDILNTASNDWTMNTYGVYVVKRQSYDRRGVSLSITYRLNPRKSKYKGKNASDAEINRL